MPKVQVGDRVWINVSRKSLCDDCAAVLCERKGTERIRECEFFRPIYTAFMKCKECGVVYEVHANISSLHYDMCPKCNQSMIKAERMMKYKEMLSA